MRWLSKPCVGLLDLVLMITITEVCVPLMGWWSVGVYVVAYVGTITLRDHYWRVERVKP